MKKLLITMLGALIVLPAAARDFMYTYEGQTLTYTVIDEEAKTVKVGRNTTVNGDLVIPTTIKSGDTEYNVTSISDFAFASCQNMTSVFIPNSVTSIGRYAFADCGALTSVEIPNSVTSIGASVFGDCSGLTSIEVSADNPNYASDGGVLFNKDLSTLIQCPCGKAGEYVIPNSVTSIGASAFTSCRSLEAIVIRNSVTSIGASAFASCNSLESVFIPKSVTSIGKGIFDYCFNLTSIEVSAENPNYASDDGVLFNKDLSTLIQCPCGKAGEYVIPNSVTSIGESAFASCNSLEAIAIRNSVTSIGASAFVSCNGLESVFIPKSVTSIGKGIFDYCLNLTSIVVSNINPNYASSEGVLFNKDLSTLIQCPCGKAGEYVIPNSVTSIGASAFVSCIRLESVAIPNSVASIGASAFDNCLNLTSVYYGVDEPIEANKSIFNNSTYNKATLFMTEKGVEKGRTIDPWMNFKNIVVYDPAGIDDAVAEYDADKPCEVYSLSGAKVGNSTLGVAPGIYVVRQGNAVKKVSIK